MQNNNLACDNLRTFYYLTILLRNYCHHVITAKQHFSCIELRLFDKSDLQFTKKKWFCFFAEDLYRFPCAESTDQSLFQAQSVPVFCFDQSLQKRRPHTKTWISWLFTAVKDCIENGNI